MLNKQHEIFNLRVFSYHFKFFHFHQIHCFNHSISSPKNTPSIITLKKVFKNSVSLVSRFCGTLFKLFCRFNESLVLWNFCNQAMLHWIINLKLIWTRTEATPYRWFTKLIWELSKYSRKIFVMEYNFCTPMEMCSWVFSENIQNSFLSEQLRTAVSIIAQFIKSFRIFKMSMIASNRIYLCTWLK